MSEILSSSGAGYLVAAYLLTWTVLSGFALYVGARARRAAAMLEAERSRGGRP